MPEKEELIWAKKSENDKRRYQREMVEYHQLKQHDINQEDQLE